MNKKRETNVLKIIASVFFIIGIIMLIVAILFLVYGQSIKKNYKKIDATVEGFSFGGNNNGRTEISYEVGGENYTSNVSEYSSSWYVGKEITVYYDEKNPNKVTTGLGFGIFTVIFGILGIIFTILGAVMLYFQVLSIKRKKRLITSGRKVYGEVVRLEQNFMVSMNQRNPWIALCKYESEDGKIHIYRSGNIWDYPGEDVIGKTVTIFLDTSRESRYYVDIDSIMNQSQMLYH